MAFMDFFRPKIVTLLKEKRAYLSNELKLNIKEQLAEVEKKDIKFPAELGEEHPFDFKECEDLYKKYGLVQGVVDKYVDYIVGQGFYIECEDARAKEIIEMFMKDNQFNSLLRNWVREGLIKGSAFLEIIGKNNSLKNISSNHMYVRRDIHGEITEFNQYTGEFSTGIFNKAKTINFKPSEIADVYFNTVGDSVYGTGIVSPIAIYINNLIAVDKWDLKLLERKANSPMDVTVGTIEAPASQADIDAVATKVATLTNKTEWVHGADMKIGVVDFGQISDKFTSSREHNLKMMFYSTQIPEVLMGKEQGYTGSSDVQQDSFQRRIASFQEEIEKVIETKIFKRVLQANGLDVDVEFQWGRPSDFDRREEIKLLTELLKIPFLEPTLNIRLQQKLADLYEIKEEDIQTMEEEKEKELEQPQPTVPGQTPQEKPKEKPKETPKPEQKKEEIKLEIKEEPKVQIIIEPKHEEVKEFKDYELKEWLGFNYLDYLSSILKVVEVDSFDDLLASNELERKAGYLTDKQTEKLRDVFKQSFSQGKSINTIVKKIKSDVKLKNLLRYDEKGLQLDKDGNPIIQVNKNYRAEMIARTETTRLANLGALENYKENNIQKVRWIAAISDRTCPECEELNGQIFDISDPTLPPAHVDCRCSIAPITEVE